MIWQMDSLLILSGSETENGRWRESQKGTSGRGQGGRVRGGPRVSDDTGDMHTILLKSTAVSRKWEQEIL